MPLLIALFSTISLQFAPFFWILLDLLSAYSLILISRYQSKRTDTWNEFLSVDDTEVMDDLNIDMIDLSNDSIPPKVPVDSHYVALFYLLNPYTILTCLALSTQSITSALTLSSIACATQGRQTMAIVLMSVSAYLSFYPLMYLVPVCLILADQKKLTLHKAVVMILVTICGLLYLSYLFMGNSWKFIDRVYGTLYNHNQCFMIDCS